jgi:predicted phosphoribosyltransferase
VAAPTACAALAATADACVCLRRPAALRGVGLWYEDFGQTADHEVCALLDQAATAA